MGAQNSTADYFVCGLHLRSELPLPELAPAAVPNGEAPMVEIRLGDAGPALPHLDHIGPTFEAAANDYLLTVRGVGRYRVRNGTEVIVEPAAASSAQDVRLFLLGTAFGALCHQRRLVPLHASAIVVDGQCIAFAGRTRAGKSTLAAHFDARGYAILADDVCVLNVAADGPPMAWPGVPRIKLWRDALTALGRDWDNLATVRDGLQKYDVPLPGRAGGAALPLARLYVLREARLPAQETIERLTGAAAFDEFLNHTYRRNLLAPMGCAASHFAQCAALVRHVPVFSAGRRWGFECFADEAAKIERHFLDSGPLMKR
jgi:hypothetical protein